MKFKHLACRYIPTVVANADLHSIFEYYRNKLMRDTKNTH